MFRIGCHLSSAGGFEHMARTAESIGANTFQFFTRNPRGGASKEWKEDDIAAMLQYFEKAGIAKPLAHAPYTLNACAKDERIREFAFHTMREDLEKLEQIPGAMYNFHPGSHVQQGAEVGIGLIAEQLNAILKPEQSTLVLLETMAGKGSEVGRSFSELRSIIDRVELKQKLGVCLDTCHVWDGGYDIVEDLEGVLQEFDWVIGLERLKAIHLNDSLNVRGSRKDRHAKIGRGEISRSLIGQCEIDRGEMAPPAFRRIVNHPQLRELPFYLETPNELEGYREEIALLRSIYKQIDCGSAVQVRA